MGRTIVWVIAFLPIVLMFVLDLIGGKFAGLGMALSFVAGPIFLLAALAELVWFRKRDEIVKGSPIGNKLAWVFGAIFLFGVVWVVLTLLRRPVV